MKTDMPGFWQNTDNMFRVRWLNALLAIGERASGVAGTRLRCDEHGETRFQHDQPFIYRVLFGHFVQAMRRMNWSEKLIGLFEGIREQGTETLTAAQCKELQIQLKGVIADLGTLAALDEDKIAELSSVDRNVIVESLCKSIGLQTVALHVLGHSNVHDIMNKKLPLVFPSIKDRDYYRIVAHVTIRREVVDV